MQSDGFQELIFWLGFLFFNFSLFAFNYFINIKEADFIPLKQLLTKGRRGIFISLNADFFRFSIDLSILILLVRYNIISSGMSLIVGYYAFLLIFNIYHYSFNKIYQISPIILNDLRLLKNGAGILWDESKIKMILGISTLILTTVTLSFFLSRYLEFTLTIIPNQSTHIITTMYLVLFSTALIRKGYGHNTEVWHRYLIHLLRLGRHFIASFQLFRAKNRFNFETLNLHRRLKVKFREKPNIYLLFIESYGSILLKHPQLSKSYNKKFDEFTNALKKSKWECKTNCSSSVSLVGPSWLAYTSVLFGNRVDTNFYYEYLLNEKRFNEFDTMTKMLQNHGYWSYNLNATKFKNGVNVPLKQMKEFYGIDQFILKDDIHYHGTKFGFTECPPDQFVLNYAYEYFLKKQSKPYVLFYLTKNSHTPFVTPDIVKNWNELNNSPDLLIGNHFLQDPSLENYSKAMDYQLDFLQDFIIRNGKGNDIFMLIGDHQPHVISKISDGTETLVHVISRNEEFLSEFESYGFRDSLDSLENPVKHEALYSIFLRSFIKTYGEGNQKLPDYEPNGLQL